jgi:ketosteroid isomerase-like protein
MTVLLSGAAVAAMAVTLELVALERQALDGWVRGEPEANLAISADDLTYFDGGLTARLEGLAGVKSYFEAYRGQPLFEGYEIVDAKAQAGADMAVLTYRLVIRKGAETYAYHATEVYQRRNGGWKVIHSHFSKAKQS